MDFFKLVTNKKMCYPCSKQGGATMNIYAIGDLHLSGLPPNKPMEVFGEHWQNHWLKIKTNWTAKITPADTVIIAGDISWALKLTTALVDLNMINDLPGKKVFLRGNHDFWWSSIKKMTTAVNNVSFFLQNNFTHADEYAICGSRGWSLPQQDFFTTEDLGIYKRELLRIESSLSLATAAGYTKKILALHFPPLLKNNLDTEIVQLCQKYNVAHCVFGHLHGNDCESAFVGNYCGTNYLLVSADYLNFNPQCLAIK